MYTPPSVLSFTFIISLLLIGLTACGSGDTTSNNTNQTNTTQKSSHNAGQNCFTRHSADGTASDLVFNSSGTVYKDNGSPQNNATVNLYTANTNTLLVSMKTDANGNFYTTEFVPGIYYGSGPFPNGVDVEIKTGVGTRTMSGKVTERGCNSCHISSTSMPPVIVAN